ncbi:trimeric intracellular cation channel family protein [Paenibacillus sp. 481]|uniref:trimeric intracellular cation channel family protein n=1 Tax=Paenibacillus sp. 481 TaxID=2835869 RepID=UPI001E59C239|nr:TRIC cation channel family protein [Paenibacillus sp. 481]UHA74887.1 TRIC cation channel family protein [Paenibacillus sp. 481]
MLLLHVFIYLGIVAGGVSGALVGIKKGLDLFGIIIVAAAAALGGGIVRDVLIGQFPPVAFTMPPYFFTVLVTALIICFIYKHVNRFRSFQSVMMISDAIGLGVFTAIGANSAFSQQMDTPFIVISMGLITGIGGGIVRDLLVRTIPYVFRKEIYAIASLAGAISYYLSYGKISEMASLYLCLGVTFTIRVLAVKFSVNFPVIEPKADKPERQRRKVRRSLKL